MDYLHLPQHRDRDKSRDVRWTIEVGGRRDLVRAADPYREPPGPPRWPKPRPKPKGFTAPVKGSPVSAFQVLACAGVSSSRISSTASCFTRLASAWLSSHGPRPPPGPPPGPPGGGPGG